MSGIKTRNFRILSDFMEVRQFMIEIYEKDWRNGVPAPFLEYALSSEWMDKSFTHRFRIWEEDGKIVAFVFYENPVNNIFFSIRPGYEELADEMVAYAIKNMPRIDGKLKFMLFKGQTVLIEAVKKEGYVQSYTYGDRLYDCAKPLEYKLPEGFHFVESDKLDAEKIGKCCWKGFDHEAEEGPWKGNGESNLHVMTTPYATPEYAVAIENEEGEYCCFAGMWWTPENNLAYMEPLCTIPECRNMGLAAAALSEMCRRMKPLGATHMTGGDNPFYGKIGYDEPCIWWTFWEKFD